MSTQTLRSNLNQAANVTALFVFFVLGAVCLHRVVNPPWYAWIVFIPVWFTVSHLSVERIVSYFVNHAFAQHFVHRDVEAVRQLVERLVREHGEECTDSEVFRLIRKSFDSSSDPAAVFDLLANSGEFRRWPAWARRCFPAYVPVEVLSKGNVRAWVWVALAYSVKIPLLRSSPDPRWFEYLETELSFDQTQLIRNLAVEFDKMRANSPGTSLRANAGYMHYTMNELASSLESDDEALAQSLRLSGAKVLDAVGAIPKEILSSATG